MTATGTPLPVEYCHAAAIPSMSNPGASWATSGLLTVIGTLQEFERRIGWSGPGTPSAGTRAGSTDGGSIARAVGAPLDKLTNSITAATAAPRARTRLSCAPTRTVLPAKRQAPPPQ